MDFERPLAVKFAVILHQGVNKLYIVFGLVIPWEAQNHCDKSVLRCFLSPNEFLWELLTLYNLLYLWPRKTPALTFDSDSLREKF